jgi:hypothetical protein
MSRFASCTVRLLLGALLSAPAAAYAQTRSFGSGSAIGVTLQAIGGQEGILEIPAVGLHITSIRPSGRAFDVTVATLPAALGVGALLLAPDVSLAYVFPVGGGGLMIKGGASGIFAATGDEAGAIGGIHVGAAAFLRLGKRFGIRAEIVPRFYAFEDGPVQLTTFGIGFTSLPAPSR